MLTYFCLTTTSQVPIVISVQIYICTKDRNVYIKFVRVSNNLYYYARYLLRLWCSRMWHGGMVSLDFRLEYSKITQRYDKVSPFTWFSVVLKTSYWYRFHPFYLSFSPGCDLNARECFDAAPQQGMLGALIVWWPASFWLQWTMAEGTVHTGSPAKFSNKPTEDWRQIRKMYAIKQIKICAEYRDMLPGTCYPGQTTDHTELKFSGQIHYGTPQAWFTFVHTPLYSYCFLVSDLSSSLDTFIDRPLIRLNSDLVYEHLMGFVRFN